MTGKEMMEGVSEKRLPEHFSDFLLPKKLLLFGSQLLWLLQALGLFLLFLPSFLYPFLVE